MIWTNPLAVIALVALAAPILVHILARHRAPRIPFPTLRFIQPFRLAAIRRRALEDLPLLAVRALILVAAAAAIAGPFLVTAARQRMWDARTIRAEVTGSAGTDLGTGIVRAVAWLERQPPGRREIVVRSAFPLGSVTPVDVASVPASVGLRFERTGTLPPSRVVAAPDVMASGKGDENATATVVNRELVLDGGVTSVRDSGTGATTSPPIEIVAPARLRAEADALMRAALSGRISAARSGRHARIAFGERVSDTAPLRTAWMGDAAARIARAMASTVVLRFAAAGDQLIVSTPMAVTDSRALQLVRAVASSLGFSPEQPDAEVLAISDEQLRAWTRSPGPAAVPRTDALDRDDRRWLWAMVLVLLAAETWMRRSVRAVTNEETARVA